MIYECLISYICKEKSDMKYYSIKLTKKNCKNVLVLQKNKIIEAIKDLIKRLLLRTQLKIS